MEGAGAKFESRHFSTRFSKIFEEKKNLDDLFEDPALRSTSETGVAGKKTAPLVRGGV
jgi:hypothetical protein